MQHAYKEWKETRIQVHIVFIVQSWFYACLEIHNKTLPGTSIFSRTNRHCSCARADMMTRAIAIASDSFCCLFGGTGRKGHADGIRNSTRPKCQQYRPPMMSSLYILFSSLVRACLRAAPPYGHRNTRLHHRVVSVPSVSQNLSLSLHNPLPLLRFRACSPCR